MKKTFPVICCIVGSGMIGFFANRLHSAGGSFCFTLGVMLLTASCIWMAKHE